MYRVDEVTGIERQEIEEAKVNSNGRLRFSYGQESDY
jgi:hypothetical protein